MTESDVLRFVRSRLADVRRRLSAALGRMDAQDVGWRPNESSNSATNLVLHICGSLRQWVIAPLRGADEPRDREAEFAERGGRTPGELVAAVDACFGELDALLAELPPERLNRTQTTRGTTMTHGESLLRSLAHVSEHAGQILYIAKARLGERFEAL